MMSPDELDAYAAALATLGRFHRQAPDDATLSAFKELLDEWPVVPSQVGEQGLDALRQSFADNESAYTIKNDLNWLYGVSAKARVSPYESVHRDRDGLVFDEQTLRVREAYRNLGLQVPALNREPDDHVGTELDFLARCLLGALDGVDAGNEEAAEQYLDEARRFLDEHVNQWAPDMLLKAAASADTQFNRGICLLSVGTLETLSDHLPAR